MLVFVALGALFILPFVAAVALRVSRDRLPRALPVLGLAATAAGLLGAWLWRNAGVDTVIANWSIASFFGAPLAIAASGGGAALIAFAAARMLASADADDPIYSQAFSSAIMTAAAALALLGSTMPALLIGVGILDVCAMWMAARRTDSRQAVSVLAPQVFGVLAAMLGFSLIASFTHSFVLDGAQTGGSAISTSMLSLAVCAHAGVLPFIGGDESPHAEQMTAGVIGAIAIAQHAPTLDSWALLLLVLGALIWSLRAIATHDPERQALCISQAAAGVMMAFSLNGAAALGGAAWLLGTQLLQARSPLRLIGALSLAGLPPLAGFAAQSGGAAALTASTPLAPAILVLMVGAQAMLIFALLNNTLRARPVFGPSANWPALARAPLVHLPAIVVALHLLLLGLAPALSGVSAPYAAMGVWGWVALGAAVALGVGLNRASVSMTAASDSAMDVPRAAAEVLDRIQMLANGVGGLLLGAVERIRTSFRLIFTMLESDGALLWACLFTLIAVLIARSSTP